MFAFGEIHRRQLVAKALFSQHDPNFLAEGTGKEVVEFNHLGGRLIQPLLLA
jgi:hypothetical protein